MATIKGRKSGGLFEGRA